MTTTPFSLIKNMLWDDYGYTLSDDPSYMTKKQYGNKPDEDDDSDDDMSWMDED